MVAYDAIRPAAYILDPDAGPFAEPYYALRIPAALAAGHPGPVPTR